MIVTVFFTIEGQDFSFPMRFLAPQRVNTSILAISVAGGLFVMALIATIIINQFRVVQLRDARDIGSAYIQGFLGPYAVEARAAGQLSMQSRTELMRLVGNLANAQRFVAVRIRDSAGGVIFASDTAVIMLAESPEGFLQALQGKAIAEIHWPDGADDAVLFPEVEIYAPIYHPDTDELIAVGEIYQDAQLLLAERQKFERLVWGAVGLASLGFVAMMFLIARQGKQLLANLAHQQDVAQQNAALRAAAETAWRSSSQSNEALLNQIGAELHDGPIQMLSLMALSAPAAGQGAATTPGAVAQSVLADLRRISAGLTLPELGQLSVHETLMLAITRHGNATGTDVAFTAGDLPEDVDDQRKTCIYRVVQEGLNNALRHGGAKGQRVTAALQGDRLILTITDSGDDRDTPPPLALRHHNTGLGIDGLRNRLKVFGGTLTAERLPGGGFVLRAELPLAQG
jgi:signal transduction histidine kinase